MPENKKPQHRRVLGLFRLLSDEGEEKVEAHAYG